MPATVNETSYEFTDCADIPPQDILAEMRLSVFGPNPPRYRFSIRRSIPPLKCQPHNVAKA
jgi:hypothetical protein